MAGAVCPLSNVLPTASSSLQHFSARPSADAGYFAAVRYRNGGRFCWPLVHSASRSLPIVCKVSERDKVAEARKFQLQATELLAELLKSENPEVTAQKYLDSLTEDFFMIASTYLEMAKKEGNAEVVNKIETALKIAMVEKGKTLRPEIQLLNQLLSETSVQERARSVEKNLQYLSADSYFFQLLHRMTLDVDTQRNNPKRLMLLAQLRTISKETKEAAKAVRKGK